MTIFSMLGSCERVDKIMVVTSIFRGFLLGATRGVMTAKRGNKNFYKGRGARGTGRHTRKGGFIVTKHRIPEIVVPNLDGFELKPYVSYKTPYVMAKPITAEDILSIVQPLNTLEATQDTSSSSKAST